MWILPLVGFLGLAVGFCFLTLAIASGLYYLSELVEEHTVQAKKLLTRLIYGIIALLVLLWLVDGFPLKLSLLSVVSHVVYAGNLRRFPFVRLTDGIFLTSCVLVLLNHYLWFQHFSIPPSKTLLYSASRSSYPDIPTFTEIASYFGLCVWLVPFALFVSLSAGDNVLPTMGSEYATGGGDGRPAGRERKTGMAKAVVDGVRDWVGETGEGLGFWRGERARM
ncbi:MAG: erv26 super protein [Thelocarpon superellum]|nr:MAG: erv26 super protein [Thelocarpon superellum]